MADNACNFRRMRQTFSENCAGCPNAERFGKWGDECQELEDRAAEHPNLRLRQEGRIYCGMGLLTNAVEYGEQRDKRLEYTTCSISQARPPVFGYVIEQVGDTAVTIDTVSVDMPEKVSHHFREAGVSGLPPEPA